jgi:hypothetical protein
MASRVLALRICDAAPRALPGRKCLGQRVPQVTDDDRRTQTAFADLLDLFRTAKRSDAQAPLRPHVAAACIG